MLQAFCSLVSRRAVLSPQPTSLEPKSVSNLTTDTGELSNKRSPPKEQEMLMTDGMPAQGNGDPGEQHQGPWWLLAASDWTAKRPGCALGDEKAGALPCLAEVAGKGQTPVLPPGAVGTPLLVPYGGEQDRDSDLQTEGESWVSSWGGTQTEGPLGGKLKQFIISSILCHFLKTAPWQWATGKVVWFLLSTQCEL